MLVQSICLEIPFNFFQNLIKSLQPLCVIACCYTCIRVEFAREKKLKTILHIDSVKNTLAYMMNKEN